MPYPAYINYLEANEKVLASTTNRPTQELALRTDTLKERLDTSDLGQAIILWDVPIAKDTVVGMPVYWNDNNKQFETAYAEAVFSEEYNEYVKSEKSNCIGLIYKKESETSGSIVLSGVVNLTGIQDVFTEDGNGRFYLAAEPGKLTYKILGVCVPVGTVIGKFGDCDDMYRVCVNPVMNDLWSHLHYVIDLVPKHVNNTVEEGWRAVSEDDEYAPADTVYVYNIIPGTKLAAVFPPIPVDSCALEIDWNDLDETVGDKTIPVNCEDCLVRVTTEGIYWVNKDIKPFAPSTFFSITVSTTKAGESWTEGDVVTIGTYEYTVQSTMTDTQLVAAINTDVTNNYHGFIDYWRVGISQDNTNKLVFYKVGYDVPLGTSCTNKHKSVAVDPRPRIMRERLLMSKIQFSTGLNCVTSLRPYPNHPFRFVDCRDKEAYNGDLYAQFTLKEDPLYINEYEGYAVRRFNDDWKQEIVPAINGISISGSTISVPYSTNTFNVDDKTYHRGLVDIKVSPLDGSEISPQIMKLGDALEREYNGIMYVGFPRDRESSILAKFEIPEIFEGKVVFSSLFYSSVSGTYPALSCQYQIIRKPIQDELVPVNTLVFNNLAWDTTTGTTAIDAQPTSAFNINTVALDVTGGDTVVLKLTRLNTGVTYGGDAGIIRLNGVLHI